jgi:uncharacterized membrane protein (DUF485 family)
MGDLTHRNQSDEKEDPVIVGKRARLGLQLFAVYCALYAGFMYLSAFQPQWMEAKPAAGVNLAIWYGLGLIVGAFAVAMIYAALCRRLEARS